MRHRDNQNRTPLILAAMAGHGEVVNFFLAQGGEREVTDVLMTVKIVIISFCFVSTYFTPFGEQEQSQYELLMTVDASLVLSGIRTYNHSHVSPELYHCVKGANYLDIALSLIS